MIHHLIGVHILIPIKDIENFDHKETGFLGNVH